MKEIKDLEAGLDEANKKNKADLFEFAKSLIADYKALGGELDEAQLLAQEAINKSNEAVSSAPKSKSIKVEGKAYKINFGVDLDGKKYTADELANDSKVVEKLIEMGSGAVELIKEGK